MILSASRRTDIPAGFSEWFINRLKDGCIMTRNPMNHSQIKKIELSPDAVDCIVFWTKDPLNILEKLPLIDKMGYKYYFQFTLTPYDKTIEQRLREKDKIIETFAELSTRIGRNKVVWRYDPVLLNQSITISYHRSEFERLCEKLAGFTDSCTISFIDLYSKLKKPADLKLFRCLSDDEIIGIAESFSELGRKYNLQIETCCEKNDLTAYGIKHGSCISRSRIEEICGYPIRDKHDKNQREGCGCIQSIDVGAYNTCKNGCIYCYANYSMQSIEKNVLKHDPKAPLLI